MRTSHLSQSPECCIREVRALENLEYGIKIPKYGIKILQDSIKGSLNEHFSVYSLTRGYLGRSGTFKA